MSRCDVDRCRRLGVGVAIATTAYGASCLTQVAHAADSQSDGLEEVVVTAEKRPERLLDVPISISALTSTQLADRGVDNVRDLQYFVPNFTSYSQVNFHPNFIVRGFDSQASNIGFESGLGIYVDGVFMGRPEALTQELADVERVEVLLGPQGTLFGKNTTLGAISVTTIEPGDRLQAAATADVGNYEQRGGTAFVAGPLIPGTLYGKISGFARYEDGYVRNADGGSPSRLQDDSSGGVRGELRLVPTSTLEFALRADWSQTRSHPEDEQIVATPPGGNPFGIPLDNIETQPRRVAIDAPNRDVRELGGASLTSTYRPGGGYEIASITAARTLSYRVTGQDADATPYDYMTATYYDRLTQFTQELRLTSPTESRLKYVLGAFYFYQQARSNREFGFGQDFLDLASAAYGAPPALLDPPSITTQSQVITRSLAGYANGSFDVTSSLALLAGVRFTYETKSLSASQQAMPLVGLPGIFSANPIYPTLPMLYDHLSESDWSPTAGIRYSFSTHAQAYVRFSKGFKSGGWNATLFPAAIGIDPTDPTGDFNPGDLQLSRVRFKPETLQNYELGAKTEWFEHKLTANVAIFQEDYRDIQVSQYVGGNIGYLTQNAAHARSRGTEIEIAARPSVGVTVGGTVGYADARYVQYANGCGPGCNLAGYRLNSPRLTTAMYGQYEHPLTGNLDWMIRGDVSYRSDAPGLVIDPTATNGSIYPGRIGGFATVDARAGVISNAGWKASLWVKNLFNRDYRVQSNAYTNLALLGVTQSAVLYGPPRTYGIRLDYRY